MKRQKNMNEERWNAVREFYMSSFGISPELVDLMASNEILLMCVSGSSNTSISKLLNIDEEAVSEIVSTIFDFPGFSTDLEFSPYSIYKEDNSFISFAGSIVEIEEDTGIEKIELMYNNCKIYSEIEERLDSDWV
jgi:hypothetical protein